MAQLLLDRPPVAPPARSRRVRGAEVRLPLAATATALAATVARSGYRFGLDDQAVLALKGISRADSTAFAGDWFTHQVPQPHWFFDLVTFAGERAGLLPLAYLAWWLASLLAFGVAAAWLARRFCPGQAWLALLVGPILALGPATALGSGTALWGFALPQGLGASLAFLTVSALLTGRWRVAGITAGLAAVAHVQHGADLAPILLATAALATLRPRRHRLGLAAAGAALIVQAAIVGRLRGIDNTGDGWLDACRLAIPFHCDANSWAPVVFVGGALVAGLALGFAVAHRREWRMMAATVAAPAAGLLLAALADRLDVPVVGHLVQRYNAYRLAGLVLPLAAFALVWLVARFARRGWTPRRAAGVTLLLLAWLTMGDAAFHPDGDRGGLLGTGLLANGVHLGYDRSDPGVAAALAVGRSTDPGSVIAADPAIYWLRAVSRRAVVADCKGIAFGGRAWEENTERIDALGGWACTPGPSRFATVSPAEIEALHRRYGVTHVLLTGDDPKLSYAGEHWSFALHVPASQYPSMTSGWWLYRIGGAEPVAR